MYALWEVGVEISHVHCMIQEGKMQLRTRQGVEEVISIQTIVHMPLCMCICSEELMSFSCWSLEIGAFEMHKCVFGGCKCRFECLYGLNACLILLNGDLGGLSAFVHL